MEHLWSALTSLASAPLPERTITGLSVLLQSNALKQALQPCILGGPWGRLLDALKMIETPLVEVHISNIHKREETHRYSKVSLVAEGVICGLGPEGYLLALRAVASRLRTQARQAEARVSGFEVMGQSGICNRGDNSAFGRETPSRRGECANTPSP